jgi:activator of HSP90 ATPase
MNFHAMNRRQAIAYISTIGSGLAIVGAVDAADLSKASPHSDSKELSHHASAIHQEIFFNASPKRVYEALTIPAQFDAVVRFISDMKLPDKPSQISPDAGGAFLLFGGYIMGRHLELASAKRLVQAWRTASWDPGLYSVATFDLTSHGDGTTLIFDQKGFPESEGEHLTQGWHSHYWEPLAKYLSS